MLTRIQCVARRMSGGNGYEHIAMLRWRDNQTGNVGDATRAQMVEYVKGQPDGTVYVSDGSGDIAYVGHRSNGNVEYVQTYADSNWNNNLLALPLF